MKIKRILKVFILSLFSAILTIIFINIDGTSFVYAKLDKDSKSKYEEYFDMIYDIPMWKEESIVITYYIGMLYDEDASEEELKSYESTLDLLNNLYDIKHDVNRILYETFNGEKLSKICEEHLSGYGYPGIRTILNRNGNFTILIEYGKNIKHSDENFETVKSILLENFNIDGFEVNEDTLEIVFLENIKGKKEVYVYSEVK